MPLPVEEVGPLIRNLKSAFTHTQDVASDEWVIVHNLGMYPIVDVYIDADSELVRVFPSEVEYTDENTCTLLFTQPYTGTATVV